MISLMDQNTKALVEIEGGGPETAALSLHKQLESLGHDVGFRFTERVSMTRLVAAEPLEAVKFLCKDLWTELFGKAIDKLQTNHR